MPESSSPSGQGALRVPSFRFPLPSHRLFLFLLSSTSEAPICLTLVDSLVALQHGETEDRYTTNHGPSLIPSYVFLSTLPRPLCRCPFALPLSSTCSHLTCFVERPNPVCYFSKGKWPCLEVRFKNRSSLVCNPVHDLSRLFLALLLHIRTQRKTGLFKKAYELGVLCSVDVAVIIFGTFFTTSLILSSPHPVSQSANLVIQTSFFNTALPTSMPSSSDK
jgi:hypothetical protein